MFRLDFSERYALVQAAMPLPPSAKAWLFGSRAKLTAKGGDIDILVRANLTEQERFELSRQLSCAFQSHCEEKIDFVIFPDGPLSAADEAFVKSLTLIDLVSIINAPRLDHVAVLVNDLEIGRGAVDCFQCTASKQN